MTSIGPSVSPRDVAYAEAVSLCPVVLQAYVPKRLELRVTVVGQQAFAAEIHSQATHRTRVDWRRYGTIDLILTPDDRYVFLELNSAGEYGWIEDLTGLPISDAIAGFLLGDRIAGPAHTRHLREETCHA